MEKKDWLIPLFILLGFETLAVALWQASRNIFYLLNFTYIGTCVSVGANLFGRNAKGA